MAGDIYKTLGINVYAEPKLKLTDDEPAKTTATKKPDTIFDKPDFFGDVARTVADTGLGYMTTAANLYNNLTQAQYREGGTPIQDRLIKAHKQIGELQDTADKATLSQIDYAEQQRIQQELANAKGVVENVKAGGKMALNMLTNPIDNAGKIVGGILDPLNFAPVATGAKVASKLGGGVVPKIVASAGAGAVSNAPVNAIEEGAFAAARGEDWQKAAAGGLGGGVVGGAILGAIAPTFGAISQKSLGAKKANTKAETEIAPIVPSEQKANYEEAPLEAMAQIVNDPATKARIDEAARAHEAEAYAQWADTHEQRARSEAEQTKAAAQSLLQRGALSTEIHTVIDNIVTPTKDDLHISSILNGGNPLPSRLTGFRLLPVLEDSIKTAIEMPDKARTNQEFFSRLKTQGVSDELARAMTQAYTAKDPEILQAYIFGKLAQNSDKIIDSAAIREQIAAKIQEEELAKQVHNNSILQAQSTPHERILNNPLLDSEATPSPLPLERSGGIETANHYAAALVEARAKAAGISKEDWQALHPLKVLDYPDMTKEALDAEAEALFSKTDGFRGRKVDKSIGDWDEKTWRENKTFLPDSVFEQLGIPKGNVFADYIRLAEKHPEYFREPKEAKALVDFVLESPEYALPAAKKEYKMLVRTNGADKGVVLDLEFKGGKYRVRSAMVLSDGQLQAKLQKAVQAGEPILQFQRVDGVAEHPPGGAIPSDIGSPVVNEILHQLSNKSQDVVNGLYMQMGEKHIIETFKSADFATVLHEYGHYFRRTLSADEELAAKKAFGVVDEWGVAHEERFANAFVKWLATGKAPTPSLEGVFGKLKSFLQELFERIKDSKEASHSITKEEGDFFAAIFGDNEAAAAMYKKSLEDEIAAKGEPNIVRTTDGREINISAIEETMKYGEC